MDTRDRASIERKKAEVREMMRNIANELCVELIECVCMDDDEITFTCYHNSDEFVYYKFIVSELCLDLNEVKRIIKSNLIERLILHTTDYRKEDKKMNKQLAKRIKTIGESIIENADSIAGSEKYISEVTISAKLVCDGTTIDEILVEKEFYPVNGDTMTELLTGVEDEGLIK